MQTPKKLPAQTSGTFAKSGKRGRGPSKTASTPSFPSEVANAQVAVKSKGNTPVLTKNAIRH